MMDKELKTLHEIYEEIKNDFDWVLINKSDGFDVYDIKYLEDQHFSGFFKEGRKIYQFIDRQNGSEVLGKIISTGTIIARLINDNSELFDFS